MDTVEYAILAFFRRYRIHPAEMLFFNAHDCKLLDKPFLVAMDALIRRGMVVKERPGQAYSLTQEGYELSRAIEEAKPRAEKAQRRKSRS